MSTVAGSAASDKTPTGAPRHHGTLAFCLSDRISDSRLGFVCTYVGIDMPVADLLSGLIDCFG